MCLLEQWHININVDLPVTTDGKVYIRHVYLVYLRCRRSRWEDSVQFKLLVCSTRHFWSFFLPQTQQNCSCRAPCSTYFEVPFLLFFFCCVNVCLVFAEEGDVPAAMKAGYMSIDAEVLECKFFLPCHGQIYTQYSSPAVFQTHCQQWLRVSFAKINECPQAQLQQVMLCLKYCVANMWGVFPHLTQGRDGVIFCSACFQAVTHTHCYCCVYVLLNLLLSWPVARLKFGQAGSTAVSVLVQGKKLYCVSLMLLCVFLLVHLSGRKRVP